MLCTNGEYIPNINAEKLFDCSMTLEGVKELSDNLKKI